MKKRGKKKTTKNLMFAWFSSPPRHRDTTGRPALSSDPSWQCRWQTILPAWAPFCTWAKRPGYEQWCVSLVSGFSLKKKKITFGVYSGKKSRPCRVWPPCFESSETLQRWWLCFQRRQSLGCTWPAAQAAQRAADGVSRARVGRCSACS